MKIAFSSTGDGWKEQLDIRFGRAKGFFIYDTETHESKYISNNDNNEVAHGAGTSAGRKIINEKVEILITGKVGPKAEDVLKAGRIKIYNGMGYGTLEEAYQKYQNGQLELQD
jgi:predicted Fe-Mo cluster-binding NifX family protein